MTFLIRDFNSPLLFATRFCYNILFDIRRERDNKGVQTKCSLKRPGGQFFTL